MERSTVDPLIPFVETTTPEFSLTSRSLRPRQRTTTLMFVSSSASNSRSLRLMPAEGDERTVRVEATDSARDALPFCAGVADRPRARFGVGRIVGGRMDEVVRFVGGGTDRGSPDMAGGL